MKSHIVNVFLLLGCIFLSVHAADASSVSSSVKAPVSSARRGGSLCSRLGAVLCMSCLAVLPVNGSIRQGEVAHSDFGELSIDDLERQSTHELLGHFLHVDDADFIFACLRRRAKKFSEAEMEAFVKTFEGFRSPHLLGFEMWKILYLSDDDLDARFRDWVIEHERRKRS